jgi:ribosomal protein S18 acetylase RimI-like enzyme
MDLEFRRYRAGDRPAVERLLGIGLREQEAFAAACEPPEHEGFLDNELQEHLEGLVEEPENWIVAAKGDERVLGCLWLREELDPLGRYSTVRQLIVDPQHRSTGIGSGLLRFAEDLARAAGTVMLLISALRTNPAWQLYRAIGFVDFPEEHREDKNPEHIVLWKPFRPGLGK